MLCYKYVVKAVKIRLDLIDRKATIAYISVSLQFTLIPFLWCFSMASQFPEVAVFNNIILFKLIKYTPSK